MDERRYEAFGAIQDTLGQHCTIVETGTVRIEGNWRDGQSTLIWDQIANVKNGRVITIDIDPDASALARRLCSDRVEAMTGDSVEILARLVTAGTVADLLYLDSMDVQWSDPFPSARHHLAELMAAWPMLQPGSILAVDDNKDGIGKGQLVADHMRSLDIDPWIDGYVIVWRMP